MEKIWQLGIDRLAQEIAHELDREDLVDFLPMMAELLDKLLCGTSECADPQEIIDYLVVTHGWSHTHAKLLARTYEVVDSVRTSSHPVDVFWPSDVVEKLEVAR